jgi:ribosomal-protein-alanine N-acetyltransferase
MNLLTVEITTSRLLLLPITMEYKDEIFAEFTEEIATYMYPRPAQIITETEAFIQNSIQQLEDGTNLQVVILAKDSKEFLGCTGLHNLTQEPQLGIWLKKSAHGNKYGLEAIAALKKWADQNLDYEYIIYPVDRNNIPSRKIPEALGGKIRQYYEKINLSGNVLQTLEYIIYKNQGNE